MIQEEKQEEDKHKMEIFLSKTKNFLKIRNNGEDLFKVSVNLTDNIKIVFMTLLYIRYIL